MKKKKKKRKKKKKKKKGEWLACKKKGKNKEAT